MCEFYLVYFYESCWIHGCYVCISGFKRYLGICIMCLKLCLHQRCIAVFSLCMCTSCTCLNIDGYKVSWGYFYLWAFKQWENEVDVGLRCSDLHSSHLTSELGVDTRYIWGAVAPFSLAWKLTCEQGSGRQQEFQWLDQIWTSHHYVSCNVKLHLYVSIVVSTATHAYETEKSTVSIYHKLGVFH